MSIYLSGWIGYEGVVDVSELNLNLLPSRAKFQATKILWNNRVSKFMLWLVIGWVVVVGIVMGVNFGLSLAKTNSDTKLTAIQLQYSTFNTAIQNNQRLKYKAKLVGELLSSRFEYSKAFKGASEFFPEGIVMTKFTLDDDKVLRLEGTAKDVDLEKVEKQVQYVNGGHSDIYKKAEFISLLWSKGYWKFTVEVTL